MGGTEVRHSSQIHRIVNGELERLCLTPGCGWHRKTSANFYYKATAKYPQWSARCIRCERDRMLLTYRLRSNRPLGPRRALLSPIAGPVKMPPPPTLLGILGVLVTSRRVNPKTVLPGPRRHGPRRLVGKR